MTGARRGPRRVRVPYVEQLMESAVCYVTGKLSIPCTASICDEYAARKTSLQRSHRARSRSRRSTRGS